ncbi:MAG: class II fumarate hydratase [Alphaproteobacteria bacterium]|nr:class II fumarate hydratase [Alphaproteobacteria bacterium]
MSTRTERDAFGEVAVAADKYWGAQTERGRTVFTIGTQAAPVEVARAFGLQKLAAARANRRLGELPDDLAAAIEQAAEEVAGGRFDDHFPLPVWQVGSGTAFNMNANEVIANRANELLGSALGSKSPVHPNDHVNRGQSSNDSFPTVMHIAAALALRDRLLPALALLHGDLARKAEAFADIVRVARTHLQDAVPMTLGQAFGGYARQVELGRDRVEAALAGLMPLAQGGTAVGTGLNAAPGFDRAFAEEISTLTGLPFHPNRNKFEGMGAHDAMVEASGHLNTVAASLVRIANDIRLLGAGPRAGLAELVIPHDGLTSSIMPGKRNPTLAEALVQVCYRVMGNHVTVTHAGAAGTFELNVAKPVILDAVLQSAKLMADAVTAFAEHLVRGIAANRERLAHYVEHSIMAATALNPHLGYETVAKIVQKAMDDDSSPKAAAVALGLLSAEEYDRLTAAFWRS